MADAIIPIGGQNWPNLGTKLVWEGTIESTIGSAQNSNYLNQSYGSTLQAGLANIVNKPDQLSSYITAFSTPMEFFKEVGTFLLDGNVNVSSCVLDYTISPKRLNNCTFTGSVGIDDTISAIFGCAIAYSTSNSLKYTYMDFPYGMYYPLVKSANPTTMKFFGPVYKCNRSGVIQLSESITGQWDFLNTNDKGLDLNTWHTYTRIDMVPVVYQNLSSYDHQSSYFTGKLDVAFDVSLTCTIKTKDA